MPNAQALQSPQPAPIATIITAKRTLPKDTIVPDMLREISISKKERGDNACTHIGWILASLNQSPLSEHDLRHYAKELRWAFQQILAVVTPRE